MPSPTWDEYFAEASAHLALARRAAEVGGPGPDAPARPVGPLPAERLHDARTLALGYDQLATEVATRLATLAQRRRSLLLRIPQQGHPPALYLDTPL